MRFACWVTKATHTHTHTVYVILIAFLPPSLLIIQDMYVLSYFFQTTFCNTEQSVTKHFFGPVSPLHV